MSLFENSRSSRAATRTSFSFRRYVLSVLRKALTRELLRQRAAALRLAPLAQVVYGCAEHADDVHASVVVEPLVLDRENRVDQVPGNAGQGDVDSLLLVDGERRPSFHIDQRRGLRHRADVAQRMIVRQVGDHVLSEPDGRTDGSPDAKRDGDNERDETTAMLAGERREAFEQGGEPALNHALVHRNGRASR